MEIDNLIEFLQQIKNHYGIVYVETVCKEYIQPKTYGMLFENVEANQPIHNVIYNEGENYPTLLIEVVVSNDN